MDARPSTSPSDRKGGGSSGGGLRVPIDASRSARSSVMDVIKALLAANVDPNPELHMRRPTRGGYTGRFSEPLLDVGATPLLRAVMANDMEVIQALLAKGASPNINAMGVTPFLVAAGVGGGGRPAWRRTWRQSRGRWWWRGVRAAGPAAPARRGRERAGDRDEDLFHAHRPLAFDERRHDRSSRGGAVGPCGSRAVSARQRRESGDRRQQWPQTDRPGRRRHRDTSRRARRRPRRCASGSGKRRRDSCPAGDRSLAEMQQRLLENR